MLVYLHIPFCDSKCHYCAFNSYVDKFSQRQEYMRAIMVHLRDELKRFDAKPNSIKSLFIGGGTPSTVEPYMYREFFDLLNPFLKDDAEITSESNPNSSSLKWLLGMQELGVNRVSFGVQSFDAKKLKKLGRNHTKEQAIKTVNTAHKIGIKNISIDLIYATSFDVQDDIDIAFSLPINHISSYALTLEKDTPFFGKDELLNNSTKLSEDFITKVSSKFPQYEISNFGERPSKHNLGYWSGDDYMGIGAGAVGFLKDARFYPHKDIQKYINNPLHVEVENLSQEELHVESIFLGLRSSIGVCVKGLDKGRLDILIKEKKLTCRGERVYNNNYLLADEITLYLILD